MIPEAKTIIDQVCTTLDVPVYQVLSQNRKREVADARFLAVYFIRKKLDSSNVTLNTIGEWFNRKKESGNCFVVHATKKVLDLNQVDKGFKSKYDMVEQVLNYINMYNNIPQY